MNPTSNLILTVRLTGEVTMNKKARARQKFIHCVHLQERFFEEREKEESEDFEENPEQRERRHFPAEKSRNRQNL